MFNDEYMFLYTMGFLPNLGIFSILPWHVGKSSLATLAAVMCTNSWA